MSHIDLRRVDLNLLVVFDTLMAEKHVGRAAQRLSVSQSAVSHALGRLRELFDDPLAKVAMSSGARRARSYESGFIRSHAKHRRRPAAQ
jgi:hypothetical protein